MTVELDLVHDLCYWSLRSGHNAVAACSIRCAAGARSLFIKVESTPNPDSMKFVPESKVVLPEKFGSGVVSAVTVLGAVAHP